MNLQVRSFNGAPRILIIIGFLILLLSFALGLGGFQKLIKMFIASEMKIKPGTDMYAIWERVPLPVFLTVYFFNITNPEEFQQGAKPKLQELGPYVYRDRLYKKEINLFPENDTARYHQYHDYTFEPSLSGGEESDVIMMINIPYISFAQLTHQLKVPDFVLGALDEMMTEKGETFARKETVRDILWDGFNVKNYVDLANDPMVEATGHKVELPESMKDGRMGLLEGTNQSHDGWYEVFTGLHSTDTFGNLIRHNYKSSAIVWKGPSCNAINGTDGMLYAPFLDDKDSLQFYSTQMCRSLTFDFVEFVNHGGINTKRYRTSKKMLESPTTNPDNWCFCPYKSLEHCTTNGFFSLAPCVGGAPLYISNPHFLFVDNAVQDLVEGLNPDPEKHWGFMDMHPITGASFETKHRFQFNIRIKRWSSMSSFEKVPSLYLPIFWIQQGAELSGPPLAKHKMLTTAFSVWKILKYVIGFFGGIVLPGIAFVIVFKRATKSEEAVLAMSKLGIEPVAEMSV